MEAFQQRVVDEKTKLDENISKLKAFISTETFKKLLKDDRDLLSNQLEVMEEYSDILGIRIARF